MLTALQEQGRSLEVSVLKELPKPNSHRNNALGDSGPTIAQNKIKRDAGNNIIY